MIWNNHSNRIVAIEPPHLRGLMYKDIMGEIAGFLTVGWKEIRRGEWNNDKHLQTLREMYNEKLQTKADMDRKFERLQVQEEEEDK
jgi:hypothetical protein